MNCLVDIKRYRLHHPEDIDEDSSTDRAMGILEIAERVFHFLPYSDLLNCSLVSKVWLLNSRTSLRSSKKCLLAVSFEEDFYERMPELVEMLDNCAHIPFCGVSITFPQSPPSRLYESAVMNRCWDDFIQILLQRIEKFKYFRLDSGLARKKIETCGIERIVSLVYDQLEGVELIGDPPCDSGLFSKEPTKYLWNLQEVKFHSDPNVTELSSNWAKSVVNRAPYLQRITGYLTVDWFQSAFSANHHLQKDFQVKSFDSQLALILILRKFHDLAQQRLNKLERLRFSYLQGRSRSSTHRSTIPPAVRDMEGTLRARILQGTCGSLKELTIVHKDLISVATLLPVCRNLTKLVLYIHGEEARDGKLLFGVCFPQYFPKLEHVEVHITYGCADDRNPRCWAPRYRGQYDHVAESVRTLLISSNVSLEGGRSTDALIFRFSQLFPNVRHFAVDKHKASSACHFLRALWVKWPLLESITLSLSNLMYLKNSLDPICCGLHEEEVENLRKFEGELAHYHAVPVAPSVLNKSSLKLLRLQIEHTDVDKRDDPGRFLLSEISGACAFSKIPNFTIELYIVGSSHVCPEFRFRLDHLRPYVNLKCYNHRIDPRKSVTGI